MVKTVERIVDLDHTVLARLRTRLSVVFLLKRGRLRCVVDVCVEDGQRDDRLARCQGSLNPEVSRLDVFWHGRTKECPHTRHWTSRRRAVSTAEALLGLLVAVGELFGMASAHLMAADDGSGKLVRFYGGLGFLVLSNSAGEDVEMEGKPSKPKQQ